MENKETRIALLSIHYRFEAAPVIKGIASYLTHSGYKVDLITGLTSYGKSVNVECEEVIRLIDVDYTEKVGKFLLPLAHMFKRSQIDRRWKKIQSNYYLALCIEMESIDLLGRSGWPLQRAVFFSMESYCSFRKKSKPYINSLLERSLMRVIQSEERAKDLEEYLSHTFNWMYLPVSIRPVESTASTELINPDNVALVYSGYFAMWACLKEFVSSFRANPQIDSNVSCFLQGHHDGTDDYFHQIKGIVESDNRFTIDDSFYDDKEHMELMQKFDISVCFYKDDLGDINWNHILFASGKIATSLWCGLAILTNIKSELTLNPPFLYVENITSEAVYQQIEHYKTNRELFKRAAIGFANKYYNLDAYMDDIMGYVHSRL